VLPREWRDGATLLYRGRELALALYRARVADVAADLFNLTVRHPRSGDEALVATVVRHWLKDRALALLAPEVAAFAARLGRAAPPVKQ
jgi:hypothetical protein